MQIISPHHVTNIRDFRAWPDTPCSKDLGTWTKAVNCANFICVCKQVMGSSAVCPQDRIQVHAATLDTRTWWLFIVFVLLYPNMKGNMKEGSLFHLEQTTFFHFFACAKTSRCLRIYFASGLNILYTSRFCIDIFEEEDNNILFIIRMIRLWYTESNLPVPSKTILSIPKVSTACASI